MKAITATELKKKLGYYLEEVRKGKEFSITKNGKIIASLIPSKRDKIALLDSFVGIAEGVDSTETKEERIIKI